MHLPLLLAALVLSAADAIAPIDAEDPVIAAEILVLGGEGVVSTATSGAADPAAAVSHGSPSTARSGDPAPIDQDADSCAGGSFD